MIRKYLPTDRQIVKDMMIEFYNSPAVLKTVPESYFDNTLNQVENNSPYVSLYLMCDGDNVAGYGLLSHTYSNEVGGQVLLIEEVYIRQAFRGKKLGSEFLQYVLANYKHCKRFRLEVEEDNTRAIKLYQSLGFEQLNYLQYVIDKD